jgi:hypothetical protein
MAADDVKGKPDVEQDLYVRRDQVICFDASSAYVPV